MSRRYDFARRGKILSTTDALIAAVAQEKEAAIVTNNVKDYMFFRHKRSKAHHVILYTKQGCTLCRGVRNSLDELQHDYDLTVEEIDISTDDDLYRRYKGVIPVVIVDSQVTLEGRIREKDLREALSRKSPARLT
ncbi:MAG: glutaredoxin family protein [Chloroflexi bacterium]|nr:glutaredoxin family protein [Chloroflexota bacterium]